MEFTAEELAIYGLIDADTYIRLTEANMAGRSGGRQELPNWSEKARAEIRKHAEKLWQQNRAAAKGTE